MTEERIIGNYKFVKSEMRYGLPLIWRIYNLSNGYWEPKFSIMYADYYTDDDFLKIVEKLESLCADERKEQA